MKSLPVFALCLLLCAAVCARADEEDDETRSDSPAAAEPAAPEAPAPARPAPYSVPKRAKPAVRPDASAGSDGAGEVSEAPPGQGGALGGAGISRGQADAPVRAASSKDAGGGSGGGAPAGCLIENVDWNPGCGALNKQGANQAMRPQPKGKTIAYRITASQLGPSGSILMPDNVPPNFEMWLSNTACGAPAAAGSCRKTTEIVYFDSKTFTPEQLKQVKSDPSYKSSYCLLPAPAGSSSGQGFWYLNVRALGEGGSRMVCWTPALKAGSMAVSYDGKHRYQAGSNPWR